MTTPMTWHRFRETEDGDEQCSRCHVVVSLEAHMSFTLPCPAGDCSSGKNPDRGCVFVPGRGGAPCKCVFCGRPGERGHADDPIEEDLDPDELAEDADVAEVLGLLDGVGVGDVLTFTLGDATGLSAAS